MRTILLFLLAVILLSGCRSKKFTSQTSKDHEREVRTEREYIYDTVYKDRVITKIKPVFSEIMIEQPCDSLGNLIPVNYTIGSGENISHVYSKEGKLYISQKIDSMQSILEEKYKSQWKQDSLNLRKEIIKEETVVNEIVKIVYPWWFYPLIGIACIILLLKVADYFNLWGYVGKILSLVLKKP